MQKNKRSDVARRAWNLLRLALLWARKGGVLKRKLMMELRLFPKFLKSLGNFSGDRSAIHYGERELSFDDTPVIHVKMHRPSSVVRFRLPRIPCINPQVDFDFDFELSDDDDGVLNYECSDGARTSFLKKGEDGNDNGCEREEMIPLDDEGIDFKAEQFITRFYEQMKMQRQVSYLQYKEMLNRGAN
ncbi:hypothetical protein U1Q18_020006 [Sarracenia purpurea var. burkii]